MDSIGQYKYEPVSWFQKRIRGDTLVLTDHISKELNELNHIRCQRIPKRPGADWRNLPEEKVLFELIKLLNNKLTFSLAVSSHACVNPYF